VGFATANEIDRIGILPATCLAVSRALLELNLGLEHILVDYLRLPDVDLPQTPLVKGDARSLSIAAASILAKTERDKLLVEMDGAFPGYYFAANKGYGTQAHREAIVKLGPCAQHRCSFSPVKDYYSLFPPE
jgi:ribonuclease HII